MNFTLVSISHRICLIHIYNHVRKLDIVELGENICPNNHKTFEYKFCTRTEKKSQSEQSIQYLMCFDWMIYIGVWVQKLSTKIVLRKFYDYKAWGIDFPFLAFVKVNLKGVFNGNMHATTLFDKILVRFL